MSAVLPTSSHVDGKGHKPAHKDAPSATNMRSEKQALITTAPPPILTAAKQNAQKKVPRRSSKPIINWFQRKLAGSGKPKRTENVPLRIADLGVGRSSINSGRQINRITSSPLPVQTSHYLKQQTRADAASLARRKTRSISLYGDEELRESNQFPEDDVSIDQSSLNRESIWSPASALEADDDASVRPIPPSSPPSPSPSRSSSSYLSDPRTFRSMAASTKPTTLLSIDLNGNGMAHIAQAPTPPPIHINRLTPHVRQSSSLSSAGLLGSAGSIAFSSLPTAQPSSRPASLRNPGSVGSISLNLQQTSTYNNGQVSSVQAPLHTYHHPRNNPRPSSPPLDNASVLTLASSAFGIPNRPGNPNYPPSAIGDSVSHYGGSIMFADAESAYVPGDDERLEEKDFDASVRALRPRSSRRGSWESEASRWSARVQGPGTPSLARERSLWTSNSVRTGGFSTENGETYETADDQTQDDCTGEGDQSDKVESPIELPHEEVRISIEKPSSPAKEDEHIPKTESSIVSTAVNEKSDLITILSVPRASTETIAHPVTSADVEPASRPEQPIEK
ncbi:hypothetical protein JR316_0004971 [Psilocybe cubensis]|uniref:Uncharacterized protein n=2 Tax=Psilocybe cubensis TaxID=181762 RepID=A0A8H7XXC5_PSICU|nr:hypothetical protein JR316_0004971 [Psilocybe cubensis]KAH9482871.1 hypothetical protein JR316_0004971 [Psilocybe cubensis]